METIELSANEATIETVSKTERRSLIHLRNQVFFELMNRKIKSQNNGEITINMVNNWFYGKNENSAIEQVFIEIRDSIT